MRPENLSDERLDHALRQQPRWEPPRHFAHSVMARMPGAIAAPPPRRSVAVVCRAAAIGALGASLTYAAGVLVVWATAALIPGAVTAAATFEMCLQFATFMLIDHATIVAWLSAAVTLSVAASVSGRVREWI